jgi:sarcosine oxidase subunit beta
MSGKLSKSYDVIIIGAGSVGVPTAYFMAKAGLSVLVLDMLPSVGQASNKHAIGGIRATHSEPAKIILGNRSLETFSTWQERYGDDIEWRQGGYSFVAYDQSMVSTLKELITWQHKHNLNIQWLDHDELLNAIPTLNPNSLHGGTYSPNDGTASPLNAAFAFHKRAEEYGAMFNFNETVLDFIKTDSKIRGVITNRNNYLSKWVINAAGGWAKPLSKKIGIDVPVNPDSHEAAVTEPIAKIFDQMIVDMRVRTGSENFYFYQHPTGKIIFCMTPDPPIFGTHTIASSAFLPKASRRLIEVMPILKNIRVRRVWRGTYPMTPDGSPIIGEVKGYEGYLLADGMCGQGFMFGPGVGQLLTHLVLKLLDEEDKIILESLSFHRKFETEEVLK